MVVCNISVCFISMNNNRRVDRQQRLLSRTINEWKKLSIACSGNIFKNTIDTYLRAGYIIMIIILIIIILLKWQL